MYLIPFTHRIFVTGLRQSGKRTLVEHYHGDPLTTDTSMIVKKHLLSGYGHIQNIISIDQHHPSVRMSLRKSSQAIVVILCLDLSSDSALEDSRPILAAARTNLYTKYFIVGTKSDLPRANTNTMEAIQAFASQYFATYIGAVNNSDDASNKIFKIFDAITQNVHMHVSWLLMHRYDTNPRAHPVVLTHSKNKMKRVMDIGMHGDQTLQLRFHKLLRSAGIHTIDKLTHCPIGSKAEFFTLRYTMRPDTEIGSCFGNAAIIFINLDQPKEFALYQLYKALLAIKHTYSEHGYNFRIMTNPEYSASQLKQFFIQNGFAEHTHFLHLLSAPFDAGTILNTTLRLLRDSQLKYGYFTSKAAESSWERTFGRSKDSPAATYSIAAIPLKRTHYQNILAAIKSKLDAIEIEHRVVDTASGQNPPSNVSSDSHRPDTQHADTTTEPRETESQIRARFIAENDVRLARERGGTVNDAAPAPSRRELQARAAEARAHGQTTQLSSSTQSTLFSTVEAASTDPDIPKDCLCPILQEPMVDPVIDQNGHSFERRAIVRWLKNHDTSPVTNHKYIDGKTELITNHALRNIIEALSKQRNANTPTAAASTC